MSVFIQQVMNALTIGCLYALIAIGYTQVYGILRLINFAHAWRSPQSLYQYQS